MGKQDRFSFGRLGSGCEGVEQLQLLSGVQLSDILAGGRLRAIGCRCMTRIHLLVKAKTPLIGGNCSEFRSWSLLSLLQTLLSSKVYVRLLGQLLHGRIYCAFDLLLLGFPQSGDLIGFWIHDISSLVNE